MGPTGEHDLDVRWAETHVDESDIDLGRWRIWHEEIDGRYYYYASGPCPACGADATGYRQGGSLPVESQGAPSAGRQLDVSRVLVRCACDASHSRPQGSGCGRTWTVAEASR